jgi:hypothetical protein
MTEKDQNRLKDKRERIRKDFFEFNLEFNRISGEDSENITRIRGAITTAAVTAENILVYAIINEDLQDKLDSLKNSEKGLFKLREIVGEKLLQKQFTHIGTIIPWRNKTLHHSENIDITIEELRAVDTAVNSFIKWFFTVYLKEDIADFSKNLYSKSSNSTQQKIKDEEHIADESEKNSLDIPDFSILSKSKHAKPVNKSVTKFIGIGIVALLTYGIFLSIKKNTREKKLVKANEIVNAYYSKLAESLESDPNDFMADTLDYFYTKPGPITQKTALLERFAWHQEQRRVEESNKIMGLKYYKDSANISYYHFNILYKGKSELPENTLRPYIRSLARIEIGLNENFKITRLKYIEIPGDPEWSTSPF